MPALRLVRPRTGFRGAQEARTGIRPQIGSLNRLSTMALGRVLLAWAPGEVGEHAHVAGKDFAPPRLHCNTAGAACEGPACTGGGAGLPLPGALGGSAGGCGPTGVATFTLGSEDGSCAKSSRAYIHWRNNRRILSGGSTQGGRLYLAWHVLRGHPGGRHGAAWEECTCLSLPSLAQRPFT